MKVLVVITEWNRPHDCEGGYTLEGVATTQAGADKLIKAAHETYRDHYDESFKAVPR